MSRRELCPGAGWCCGERGSERQAHGRRGPSRGSRLEPRGVV